jgi:arylsulfatase A-like enzyme
VKLRVAAFVAFGAACGPRGCSPPPEPRELLGERLPIAQKRFSGVLLEFGSPQALPFLDDGWSYGEPAPDGGLFRWAVSERASFRFASELEGPHLGYLECAPFIYPGSPAQFLALTVNGEERAPFELGPGRARHPIELRLVRGENRIELRFRYAGTPTRSAREKRRLAAAFHRFEVPAGAWTARVGPFGSASGGVLVPSGGSLSFFLELPRGSRLRLRAGADDPPELRAPRGAEVTVSVGDVFEETFSLPRIGAETWERELPELPVSPVEVRFQAGERDLLLRPEILSPGVVNGREPALAPEKRPNVVVVILDGASAVAMGLYGGEKDRTPFIDALGRESVVFDAAVSQAVYTIASIGSLLTGQYPDRHQSVSFADRLREDVVTLPAILGRAGYRTAAFAGNAVVSRTFGLDRGYQEFVSVWERAGYTGRGDSVVRAFREWLETRPPEPYFAYVHLREPHFPYDPPPPFAGPVFPDTPFPRGLDDAALVEELNRRPELRSEKVRARVRDLYLGNLAYADSLVQEILGSLGRDTVVVLTADHGEALFEHGFLGHNTQLYEESVRVPLLVRGPGFAPRRVSDLAEVLDLAPTILEIAGLSAAPELSRMQGRSLVPALHGEPLSGRKLAFTRTLWAKPRYSVRTERHKLIWDSRTGASELYDLETDPKERTPATNSAIEGYLKQELFLWYREQERLKAADPAPDDAVLTEQERRELESLNYLEHLPQRKP